jgi:hypothetical protein
MTHELTPLHKSLIERLYLVGMEDSADRAKTAWTDRKPYPAP